MADNVIHGTGRPRFVLPASVILTDKVSSSTSTTVVLSEAGVPFNLDDLDAQYGLKGIGVWTKNSDDEDTWGVLQSFVNGTNTLTVDAWSNGLPEAAQDVELKGRYIDLPYCQKLNESFTPDFIVKKMLNGNIVRIKRGFYYSASLDYARYLHKDEMEIIRYLFEKTMNGCGFYPRKDNTAVVYTIDIDPESAISFYQLQNHQGHGGVVINIMGITRVDRIPFNDPITVVADAPTADDGTYPTADDGYFPTT